MIIKDEKDGTAAIRASHGERDAALRALAGHYADGRLDAADFDERADAALAARTRDELGLLFADLPDPPLELRRAGAANSLSAVGVASAAGTADIARAVRRRPVRGSSRADRRRVGLVVALAALAVLAVVHGHPPVPLIPLLFILGRRARPWTREARPWS